LKENEQKGKQPGNGTQEPRKKTARDRDPRTRGDESEYSADSKRDELHRALKSALETQSHRVL